MHPEITESISGFLADLLERSGIEDNYADFMQTVFFTLAEKRKFTLAEALSVCKTAHAKIFEKTS